jgi:hypothetical protein
MIRKIICLIKGHRRARGEWEYCRCRHECAGDCAEQTSPDYCLRCGYEWNELDEYSDSYTALEWGDYEEDKETR